MTKGEQMFVDQMTRKLLVQWCCDTISSGTLTDYDLDSVFHQHAQAKGWLSKDGSKVTSSGFTTAAGFLKR